MYNNQAIRADKRMGVYARKQGGEVLTDVVARNRTIMATGAMRAEPVRVISEDNFQFLIKLAGIAAQSVLEDG